MSPDSNVDEITRICPKSLFNNLWRGGKKANAGFSLSVFMLFSLNLLASSSLVAGTSPEQGLDEITELIEELGLRESSTPSRELLGWKKPTKVAVLTEPGDLAKWQAVAPGVEISAASGFMGQAANAVGAEVVVGFCLPGQPFEDKALVWLQSMTAGVENCVKSERIASGSAVLTNAQGLYGPEIAEHVLAMALTLTRGVDVYQALQSEESWQRQPDFGNSDPATMGNQTMLVVGLGGIGRQVAKRAKALGMTVLATRNSSREGPSYVDRVGLANELPELLGHADIVVNATPLTPSTTGLFDEKAFAAMKPSAYFINIGRGPSVVTADLVDALRGGAIAGAGLDVTDPEPLPDGHPLWTMPRVIITPHVAARSPAATARLGVLARENLRRYIAGEPLLSVVNVERGY